MFIEPGVVISRTPEECYVVQEKITTWLYQCRMRNED